MNHPPCSWCESLSQEEVDILDTYGVDILVWLQSNAFLLDGTFQYETSGEQLQWTEFQSAIRIAEESLSSRKQACKVDWNAMHQSTMKAIAATYTVADKYLANRPKATVYFPDWSPGPKRPSLYHDVIDLSLYSHRRKGFRS